MNNPDQSKIIEQEILPEEEAADSEQLADEVEQPAAPEKSRVFLVPNRHDRRRAAAKARRERRRK